MRLWTGGSPSENSWLRPGKWVEVLTSNDKVGQTLIGVFGGGCVEQSNWHTTGHVQKRSLIPEGWPIGARKTLSCTPTYDTVAHTTPVPHTTEGHSTGRRI